MPVTKLQHAPHHMAATTVYYIAHCEAAVVACKCQETLHQSIEQVLLFHDPLTDN